MLTRPEAHDRGVGQKRPIEKQWGVQSGRSELVLNTIIFQEFWPESEQRSSAENSLPNKSRIRPVLRNQQHESASDVLNPTETLQRSEPAGRNGPRPGTSFRMLLLLGL